MKIIKSLLNLLVPPVCLGCNADTKNGLAFCALCCDSLFTHITTACRACGLPLEMDARLCGACQHRAPLQDRTTVALQYTPYVAKLMSDIKFKEKREACTFFSACLQQSILSRYASDVLPDVIVPMPLHRKRLQTRGFNQAMVLAKPLSEGLKRPIHESLLKRIKYTDPQMQLDKTLRAKNVRDAFTVQVSGDVPQHIALVDDVLTTGATVSAAVKACKAAGIQRIDVWCVARVVKL